MDGHDRPFSHRNSAPEKSPEFRALISGAKSFSADGHKIQDEFEWDRLLYQGGGWLSFAPQNPEATGLEGGARTDLSFPPLKLGNALAQARAIDLVTGTRSSLENALSQARTIDLITVTGWVAGGSCVHWEEGDHDCGDRLHDVLHGEFLRTDIPEDAVYPNPDIHFKAL